jgi:hypothetical protein
MLKIYADRTLASLAERHVVMLYPFWGRPAEDSRNPAAGRYDRYMDAGPELFEETDLAAADLAILPTPWEDIRGNEEARQAAERFVREANWAGKPTAAFFWGDSDEAVPLADALVFRTSFYRSTRKPTEFALPAWSEDPVEKYFGGQLALRPKTTVPVVGFCGWAGPAAPPATAGPLRTSLTRRFRRSAKRLGGRLGLRTFDTTRVRALEVLAASTRVATNFTIRDRYLGAPVILAETASEQIVRQIRMDFWRNTLESDYVLCARGVGNYSYRLYETLSAGRIPVFVNTDCVLPYDFMVDWRDYCVWVEEDEIGCIAEKVAEYHKRLSPEDFLARQRACRRLWEEMLSPAGFFRHFDRHLAAVGMRR